MSLFGKLFSKKDAEKPAQTSPASSGKQPTIPTDGLMTSQLPALYLKDQNAAYRDAYRKQLGNIGFSKENAEKLFDFECDILRRYEKPYLLQPEFTQSWFFGLKQPFFQQYPKTKEDILKEKSLTMSELCKIIDEAEWHFWNSHEKAQSDEVWAEISNWRLKGSGADFAISYFEMISRETGIPAENIAALSSLQGQHLSRYKWH